MRSFTSVLMRNASWRGLIVVRPAASSCRVPLPHLGNLVGLRCVSQSAVLHKSVSTAEPDPRAPLQKPQTLVAAKGTARGRLAGAIAAQIRNAGVASVAAMGPEAAYVALRSVIVAGEYLRKEKPEQEVAFAVERQELDRGAGGAGDEQVEMRFLVRLVPAEHGKGTGDQPGLTVDRQVDVRISQSSNVGNLASFLARTLAEDGGVPALRGMGAAAASQALKAVILARKYLAKDSGKEEQPSGSEEELLLVPLLLRTLTDGSRKVEMVLRCRRASHSRVTPSKD